jgi:crotonobetainyl-CoA:carnitine CoA-transferase CaiB-like acyl-CoA transferase
MKMTRVPLGGMAVVHRGMGRFKVLDFSRLLPGPYATQLLADLGMRVTCVEFPQMPETSRTLMPALFMALNRGKRRLIIDPKTPQGLRRIEALARKADVIVEGFRPGVMERLGIGYAKIKKTNPKLVYCSMSGYRPNGKMGSKAGHDLNFLAQSGWLGLTQPPRMPPAPLADMAGSLGAVAGVLAALLEGRGRHVQVALTDAAHSILALPLAGQDKEPWWSGSDPFYRLYRTKDHGWIAVGALEKRFSGALMAFLGQPKNLEAAFAARTTAQWTKTLAETDFCVTPVLSLKQAARQL